MKIMARALIFVLCSTCWFLVLADSHVNPTGAYRSTSLTSNLHLLQGKGGNIVLMTGNQGLVLVDAGYREMTAALKNELDKHGGLDKLSYVINTHWHGDHTQGNYALGDHALIVAHNNVRKRLLSKQEIALFKMASAPFPESALPEITYDRVLTLSINNQQLKVVHYENGHTDGDSVVFFEDENVVHMGDHYFSGMFPFVDVGTGGSAVGMANNIKQILPLLKGDTQVVPGHGALSNKAALVEYVEMLIGTTDEVRAMKVKGLTLEAMQSQGLSSKWKKWGGGFISEETWISIVRKSLK